MRWWWRVALVPAALCLIAAPAIAHDVITTRLMWTEDISRIVYKHCASCHREGGAAMSLETYDDARPWAKAIRDEVLSRRMPPWGAVKGVGSFRDDPSAPKGDDIYLPPAPAFAPSTSATKTSLEGVMPLSSSKPLTLDKDIVASGIHPRRLASGAWLDVTAVRPDGSVAHLIWIRDWRPQWERTFYFHNPVRLPKGTRIMLYSNLPAEAALTLDTGCVEPRRDNKAESSTK
jgi:hypothetical protein